MHGGFPAALATLRGLAPPILYGDGFWQRPRAASDALGGATEDELAGLNGLRAAIRDARLGIVHESLATNKDWARYEETRPATAKAAARQARSRTPTGFAQRRALPGAQTRSASP